MNILAELRGNVMYKQISETGSKFNKMFVIGKSQWKKIAFQFVRGIHNLDRWVNHLFNIRLHGWWSTLPWQGKRPSRCEDEGGRDGLGETLWDGFFESSCRLSPLHSYRYERPTGFVPWRPNSLSPFFLLLFSLLASPLPLSPLSLFPLALSHLPTFPPSFSSSSTFLLSLFFLEFFFF